MNEARGWQQFQHTRSGAIVFARAFFRKRLIVAHARRKLHPTDDARMLWQYRVIDPATAAVHAFEAGFATAEGAMSAAMIATRLLP